MFKLKVGYPAMDEELIVMQRMAKTVGPTAIEPYLRIAELMKMRETLEEVFIDEKVERVYHPPRRRHATSVPLPLGYRTLSSLWRLAPCLDLPFARRARSRHDAEA